MASTVLFKLLGGFLAVGAAASIPTAIIYSSSNNSLAEIDVNSFETQKRNCWIILSDTVNHKDLSVCKNGEYLKYYVVNKNEDEREGIKSIKEVEKVLSSDGGDVLGGNIIVKPKGSDINESLSGIKDKVTVLSDLHRLSQGGLYNKCKNIEEEGSDSPKLNCGHGKSIPLTKYQN